ncbi:hypothetical protein CC85DRAFT_300048 [Cutaneotrichosporon oleaginosum]|uniref:RNA polymerase II elongation factor ELL N-terminal domain-containing protein n=1 Tax=Cutaneotrichosporon oleaginosum TaxID=879819 RepID=A0A0J0XUN2_9TREE|nr:uncharacterized protein CC85DRAFT_300048 [Cutaneotrichosporon oleaginosum]KLT44806.1 hypothetical protein CC85DRAFT_300048 [Cutaneotrichosporon oleaginosum]TXT11945.1 hypothetical protein COLE_02355 [Cutaneotrichosporon oleaginosum]
MPLPSGTIPLAPGEPDSLPAPAFLVRFPEDAWSQLAEAAANGGEVNFTVDGGISLNLPGQDPIPLEAHGTGAPSELYSYNDGQLEPVGSAAGRLSVPFTAGATFRAAEKMAQKNVALERQRAQRAERVTGKPVVASAFTARPVEPSNFHASPIPSHVPMARTQSGPASMSTERIPLKTRVVQHLALGPSTMQEIIDNVGGDTTDIGRTVNVIGEPCGGEPAKFRLRPAQYAKIKIADWKYTYDEVVTVVALARQAFEEIQLPADDWARSALDKKETEALATAPRERSPPEIKLPPKVVSPPKAMVVSPPKAISSLPPSRAESPAPGAPATKKAAKDNAQRTKVGKQIAKMRSEHVAKRASSLPNTKSADGTASPRLGPTSPEGTSPKKEPSPPKRAKAVKEKPPSKVEKKSKSPPEAKPALSKERQVSGKRARDYTSSEDSDSNNDRGHGRGVPPTANGKKAKTKTAANGNAKKRPSPEYTSSEDEGAKRQRTVKEKEKGRDEERTLPSFKRRVPTSRDLEREKKANGHAVVDRSPRTPAVKNHEALRRRFEELLPQYHKLKESVAGQFNANEALKGGEMPSIACMDEAEAARAVEQFRALHRELQEIQREFYS